MNSWCFTLALCCIRALGQTLEVPPADYGSYGSYDSYGDDVGLTAASETPGVVHSSHSYGRYVADVGVPHSIHHRHTVVMGDLDPTVGMPHAMHDSHTVTVPDATYLRGPSEIESARDHSPQTCEGSCLLCRCHSRAGGSQLWLFS